MTQPTATTQPRPLLVNGEALRVDVTAPSGGGGPKYEPRTAETARDILLPQVVATAEAASTLPPDLRAADQVYFEAKLLPNYLAASYFPQALLAQIGATPVGSRADTGLYETRTKSTKAQTRRLILAVPDTGLAELEALISSRGRGRTEVQAFAEIRKLDEISLPDVDHILRVDPEEVRPRFNGETRTWEAVLNPRGLRAGEAVALDDETLDRWSALVSQYEGRVHNDFVRRVGGLTFSPVTLPADADPGLLARFNPLRALRPMPAIRPRPRFGVRSVRRVAPAATSTPLDATVTVAVFDGGVDEQAGPSPLFTIPIVDLTPEPPEEDSLDHGTGVTGAVLYGLLTPGQQAPQPPLPVESFRVLPSPDIPGDLEGYWVLDQILNTVKRGDFRIVNLSLGPTLAVEDDLEPNRWTSELDQLAWENDVLFVVAAGNDGDADQTTGLHRVQVPADMVNGLSVGACDVPAPGKPWNRASYSSMGPGRYGARIQPIGLQFGGSPSQMFDVVRADGSFLEATGTSFAAPVTTHAVSELVPRLPRVNSSVLRSFVTHFSERPSKHNKLRNEVGYGRQALDYTALLDCTADEAHVLYVDEIERGELLGYQIPAPLHAAIPMDLRLTLAYASPIDPTQPTEYTTASLDLLLRPHHQMYSFGPPTGTTARRQTLDLRSAEAGRLMQDGWTPSQEPVTRTLSGAKSDGEAKLRDAGKWETLRHYRVALKAGETELPRLELTYVARRSGAIDNSPTKVPFAVLLTLIDPAGGNSLYDGVRADHRVLVPAQRTRTRVRTRGSSTTPHWH